MKDNRKRIIQEIINNSTISRANIAKITKLNKATISNHIDKLINEKLIIETEFAKSSGGRRPILLTINKKAGFVLGIDVDRTQITSYLLYLNGEIVDKIILYYDKYDYNELLEKLVKLINKAIIQSKNAYYQLIGIGISIHGLVKNNSIIQFIGSKVMYNLYEDLRIRIGDIPLYIDNNANLGAIFEHAQLKDNNINNLLYLTLSSGIGLGIINNQKLYSGSNGLAGEFGHTIIEINGRKCHCGSFGCLEQYASISVLLNKIKEIVGQNILDEDIINMLKNNDKVISKEVNNFLNCLLIGINNLIQLYNPDKIIIEYNKYLDILYPIFKEFVQKINLRNTCIKFSKITENISAIGGAFYQLAKFLNIDYFTSAFNTVTS